MTETALFIVGIVVFAITVYGVVIAGGLMLSRKELEQDDDLMARVDQHDLDAVVPLQVKY